MFQPIRNQILFKPLPPDEVSLGGIYLPESARQVNNKGVIVKTGNGTKNKPMTVKPGQVGIRVKDWGEPIEVDGELCFIMDNDAIIAIVE